ncbi:MAG: ComEC/Rec2 family competence protein, partial [Gaiellaceae bacterium]
PGLRGERRGVLEAVVLGDAQGVPGALEQRFRAAGISHLLVVSGEHVGVVGLGALWLALLLGVPRLGAEAVVLLALSGYVLAVGPHPSVIRAGIGGALGSLAWLTGRQRDALYALEVAAVALLAWNPYDVLDAGVQLSFAAVLAIFFLAPRFARALEGYPLPPGTRAGAAVAAACGLATAPVCWFQFHQIPLLTVPANLAAAPTLVPMLGLAFASALVSPVAPPLAHLLAWLNGWCAAYLAACARLFGGLPGAQITSPRSAALLALCVLGAAAYAWLRGRARAEARLPAHRQRQAEDRASAAAAAGADR